MDRRELADDPIITMLSVLRGFQSGLWTALPAKVVSVANLGTNNTVDVQPVIVEMMRAFNSQVFAPTKLPPLLDCPVHFAGGGPFVLTFPIAVGDEGLVVFSSRCIDNWYRDGADLNQPAEGRMHDLSDGFFIPGFRSVPQVIQSLNLTDVELRNKVGDTYVRIKSTKDMEVTTPGKITLASGGDCTFTVGGKLIANVTGEADITCSKAVVTTTGDANVVAGGNASITATTAIQLTAPTITFNCATLAINATTAMTVTCPAATHHDFSMSLGGVNFSSIINESSGYNVQHFA